MVSDLIAGRRAATIREAVDIMTALDDELSDTDGLKWFNRLYLHVTLAVGEEVTTATFRDPRFLGTLDVLFANLYFDASPPGVLIRPAHRRRGVRCSSDARGGASAGSSSRWLV